MIRKELRACSLFSGCGGLDLGFRQAGYNIVFANEHDHLIWSTYEANHPETLLNRSSVVNLKGLDIPSDIDILIGGPPCQSYSESGKQDGERDARGKLFFEYTRLLKEIKPKVFVAENVRGILTNKHKTTLAKLYKEFDEANYHIHFYKWNLSDYGIAQDRIRVFFIGVRKDLGIDRLDLDLETQETKTLRDVIFDLNGSAVPFRQTTSFPNHEYFVQGYSSRYMGRNRVRGWDEASFTIQASARHAPQHPNVEMVKLPKAKGDEPLYYFKDNFSQRLSVRECARIQTFPDDFIFMYTDIRQAYKMIGNAVPPYFSKQLAEGIRRSIFNYI